MEYVSGLYIGPDSTAPAGFTKWVNKDGVTPSFAPASSVTPAFLWVAKSKEKTVTDVKVLYGNTTGGVGSSTMPNAAQVSAIVSVAFTSCRVETGAASSPLPVVAVHVVREGLDDYPNRPTRPETDSCFVSAERIVEAGKSLSDWPPIRLVLEMSHHRERYNVGDRVLCLDPGLVWREARVLDIHEGDREGEDESGGSNAVGILLSVSYEGWDEKYEEDVPTQSNRIGGRHELAGAYLAFKTDDVPDALPFLAKRIDDYISDAMPVGERAAFLKGELPRYVETILASSYSGDALRDRVNGFNEKVLELCVYHLERIHEPVPPEVLKNLERVFMADKHCDFFFSHYGGILPTDRLAPQVNGYAAKLPPGGASRYYVSNLNYFHRLGGYDAMLVRLNYMNALAKLALAGNLTTHAAFELTPVPSVESAISASVNADLRNAPGERPLTYLSPVGSPSSPAPVTKGSPQWTYGPLAADHRNPAHEVLTYARILAVPWLCFTYAFSKKQGLKLRDAIFKRVLTLPVRTLQRVSADTIEEIRACLRKQENRTVPYEEAVIGIRTADDVAFDAWSVSITLRRMSDPEEEEVAAADESLSCSRGQLDRLLTILENYWGQKYLLQLLSGIYRALPARGSVPRDCNFDTLRGTPYSVYGSAVLSMMMEKGLGYPDILALVVNADVAENRHGTGGLTALHAAAENDDGELCSLVVRAGVSVDVGKAEGMAPLLTAASKNAPIACRMLLQLGASADATDASGHNPLQVATAARAKRAALALLDLGVKFPDFEEAGGAAGAGGRAVERDDRHLDAAGEPIALTRLDRWNNRLAGVLSAEITALGPNAAPTPISPELRGFARWACALPLYVLQRYGGPSWAPESASEPVPDRRKVLLSELQDDAWERRKAVILGFVARKKAFRDLARAGAAEGPK